MKEWWLAQALIIRENVKKETALPLKAHNNYSRFVKSSFKGEVCVHWSVVRLWRWQCLHVHRNAVDEKCLAAEEEQLRWKARVWSWMPGLRQSQLNTTEWIKCMWAGLRAGCEGSWMGQWWEQRLEGISLYARCIHSALEDSFFFFY